MKLDRVASGLFKSNAMWYPADVEMVQIRR